MAAQTIVRGDRVALTPADGGWSIVTGGEVVGCVGVVESDGVTLIDCVTLLPAASRAGLGMEAVRVLARHLAGAGHARVDALADGSNGLTVYFWLRLGFRPADSGTPMRFTRDLLPSSSAAS